MPDDVPPGSVSGDALRTVSYEIEREVALGRLRDNEIVWCSVDGVLMRHDEDEAALNWHGERILRSALANHIRQQSTWPVTTDCHRLDAALAELEQARILCRQDFTYDEVHGHEQMEDHTRSRTGQLSRIVNRQRG